MSAAILAKGLLTWIPGIRDAFYDRGAARGTDSSAYCYGVWMKHLTLVCAHGMQRPPATVLELGPGASVGTGVAALLSGAERYVAVDTVAHMKPDANAAVFHELVGMFRNRAPGPASGFPPFQQYLDERRFPSHVLDQATLGAALDPARLDRLERAVRAVGTDRPEDAIRYYTWSNLGPVPDGSIDMLFSHVVINHIEDLHGIYDTCARWVRPGGWMTHQIDFTSLGTSHEWNGHRRHGELAWKVIAGRRPYFVSREPLATHLASVGRSFDLAAVIRGSGEGGMDRSELAPRWRGISDEDHMTNTAFIVARRREAQAAAA